MKAFQKVLLSFLLATAVFTSFAVAAYSGLFDLIDTRFYNQRIRSTTRALMDEAADVTAQYSRDLLGDIGSLAASPSIGNVFLINQSRADTEGRAQAIGRLSEVRPEIDYVRVVDNERGRLWFSTLEADIRSRSDVSIEYQPVEALDPPLLLPQAPEDERGVEWISERGGLRVTAPVLDSFSIPRGILVAWAGGSGLFARLVDEGIVGPSQRLRLTPAGILVFNAPRHFNAEDLAQLDAAVVEGDSVPVLESAIGAAFAVERRPGTELVPTGVMLIPEAELHMDRGLRAILLVSVFVVTFLVSYLILNIRQDPTVIVAERFRRFQQAVVRDYLREGRAVEPELWKRELDGRRARIDHELQRGLGRMNEEARRRIEQEMSRNWNELYHLFGTRGDAQRAQLEPVSLKQIESIIERTLSRYGRLQAASPPRDRPTSPEQGVPALSRTRRGEELTDAVDEIPEAEPVDGLEEIAEAEPVGELDEISDAEPVDELEEIAEAEPIDELEDIGEAEPVDELEEVAEAEPIDELEEVAEAEPVDELEEIAEAEPVDELEEVAEAEPIDALREADPTDGPEGIAKAEPFDELEEVAETKPADALKEVVEAEPIDELEGIAEAEPVDELEEIPDAEPVDELEEVADAEPVGELDEISDAESVDELEEIADAEPVDELEEVAEAEPIDALREADPTDGPEGIAEAEPVDELEEVAETKPADALKEVVEAEPIDELEGIAEAEPVDELEEIPDAEPVDGLEDIAEAEPVDRLEENTEAEPIDELEGAPDGEAFDDLEEIPEAEPIDTLEEMFGAESVDELEEIIEADALREADEVDPTEEIIEELDEISDAEPVGELEEIAEAEPVDGLGGVEGAEPVDELEEVADAEPAVELDEVPDDELEEVAEAEPVDELEEVAEAEPIDELEEIRDVEPDDEFEDIAEAEPVERLEEISDAESDDELEEIPDAEPTDGLEEISDAEFDIELEDIAEAEQVDELEEVAEAEPVDELEEIAEAEPIDELEGAPDGEAFDDLEEIPEAEPIDTLEEMFGTESVDELEEIIEADALREADEVDPTEEIIEELDEISDAEPVGELEEIAEAEPVEGFGGVEGAEPVGELGEIEGVRTAEPAVDGVAGGIAQRGHNGEPATDGPLDEPFLGEILVEEEIGALVPESEWLAEQTALEESDSPLAAEGGAEDAEPVAEAHSENWSTVSTTPLELSEDDDPSPAASGGWDGRGDRTVLDFAPSSPLEEDASTDADSIRRPGQTAIETADTAEGEREAFETPEEIQAVESDDLELVEELEPVVDEPYHSADDVAVPDELIEELDEVELDSAEALPIEEIGEGDASFVSPFSSFGGASSIRDSLPSSTDDSRPAISVRKTVRPTEIVVRGIEDTDTHHVMEIEDFFISAGRRRSVFEERDGLVQIQAAAYFAEYHDIDQRVQLLAEQVLLHHDLSSIDDILKTVFDDLDFDDIFDNEESEPGAAHEDSALRVVSGAFEFSIKVDAGNVGVRQVYRELVQITRRWNARVALVLDELADGRMQGSFGIGLSEECDSSLALEPDCALVRNVFAFRRVALLKRPLSFFRDFADTCHARKLVSVNSWLLLPLRDTGARRYLMVGFSRPFDSLIDLTMRYDIVPRAV